MTWSWAIPFASAAVLMLALSGRAGVRRYGPLMGVSAGLLTLGLVEVIVIAATAGGGNGIIPGAILIFTGWSIAWRMRIRDSARQLRASRPRER
jgi:hypothetical protein